MTAPHTPFTHDTPLLASAPSAEPPAATDQTPATSDSNGAIEQRLKALRNSPGFALIANSSLLLKACQLDMDAPPSRRQYLRAQLALYLKQKTGQKLDPDQLHVTFTNETHPAVHDDGHEHDSLRLSLTELALASFDPPRYMALYRSTLADTTLLDDVLSPSASDVLKLIANVPWTRDYGILLETFWARHRQSYRTLSRLGFLDTLARQYARGQISRYGYFLTLDALGLKDFPTDLSLLEQSGRGETAEVRMLTFNGDPVAGLFQVSSTSTSHCFIHVLDNRGTVIEYISIDPAHMTGKLLAALNDAGIYEFASHLLERSEKTAASVGLTLIEGDVFAELTDAQTLLAEALLSDERYDRFDLLRPVARSLTLASGADLWQSQPSILKQLPEPSRLANRLMSGYLSDRQGLQHDPDHVFLLYRRGTSTTPLGDARTPAVHVHTPHEKPISLSEALVTQYRVQTPLGYIDHGGKTVVFLDPTGQGQWAVDTELAVDPYAVEEHIRTIDFLALMTERIDTFWEQEKTGIEQAFQSTFICQALIAVKQGRVTRDGFDLILASLSNRDDLRWHDLGFHVQGSVFDGMHTQYTGLLVLEYPGKQRVLYQAGHPKAFIECADEDALNAYLVVATADSQWREAVLHHVPVRHHQRLEYLFKLWGGVRVPSPPVSILRPWTDQIYNPDTYKAMQHVLCKRPMEGSPFAFLHRMLKQNALMDAEDRIVTSGQVTLKEWTDRLEHLQLLLAPMSILLTPALIASLATEIGIVSLNIASAHLPGGRHAEKSQALLAILSLGLLHLGPRTPKLLRSMNRLIKPSRQATRVIPPLPDISRVISAKRSQWMSRQPTRLETFFHTQTLLKRWTLVGRPYQGGVPVHAWKLGRRFLLWTSDKGQARTLVVSTHGHYLPWASNVKIPNGTELRTYAPHGYELVDPLLHNIVSRRTLPFAASSAAGNTPLTLGPSLAPLTITDKLMAGTSLPGRFKNYTLSKFQTLHNEPYGDIANIVRNANASPLLGHLPPTPMDVLTVRNRFGMPSPTLSNLFNTLSAQGIHYDKILLVHCRCAAIASVLQRAPVYKAPTVKPTIVKMP
ncbi:dermonecrotic toxin domain-containing protein [Pseudomonas viridiflava]|uniref:dermonecrotic toxin domain-containing protein n=1 Tax=Pseudomonas viridiflava TaxID=33069 RepID=UPI001C31554A|nr:DUF6543 domain-containing protein [Pseudomonas viridiflava]QXG29483.1 hypothetical protein KTT59_21245 [Pseudomonas viridiflava]